MSDKSDPSFFAAVRAVICFIVADGKFDIKEREFFFTLMDAYGFSREERRVLERDFENPPDLAELYRTIYRPEDRDRLMRWARGVVRVDGEVREEENDLIEFLKVLEARMEPSKS
jgi:uncharacterized membrane protein YebE (DUF533 family)